MAIKRNYGLNESSLTCDECGVNIYTEKGGIVECDDKLLQANGGKEEAFCWKHGESGKRQYDTWITSPGR